MIVSAAASALVTVDVASWSVAASASVSVAVTSTGTAATSAATAVVSYVSSARPASSAASVSVATAASVAATACKLTAASAAARTEISSTSVLTEVSAAEMCSMPVSRMHSSEEVSSTIAVPPPWCAVIPVVVVVVVSVDAEAPTVSIERNRTVEVVDCHQARPDVRGEQCLQGKVACGKHCIVVVVAQPQRHIVEVVVHTADVVVVDVVQVVKQVCAQSQCVCHTVGEETRVHAHSLVGHWLGVYCQRCKEESNCCE